MSESISVENVSPSDLTFPCGFRIPARKAIAVPKSTLATHRDHPVVRHWFEKKMLVIDGLLSAALGGKDSGADIEKAKADLAHAQARIEALEAERNALAAHVGGVEQSLTAAGDEITRLTAERDAALAAKSDAEALAALAQEELTKAAEAKATETKPKGAKA